MADTSAYSLVPRAIRSLGRTAAEIIPARARAEERLARTKFDIGRAERAETHRTREWEASEKAREEAREERAITRPTRVSAAMKARLDMEEMARREKEGTQLFNPLEFIRSSGGTPDEIVARGEHIIKDAHLFGISFDPETKSFTREGQIITKNVAYQKNSPMMALILSTLDPGRQFKGRGMKEEPEKLIQEYNTLIGALRRIQKLPWPNPETVKYLENKISDAHKEIDRLEKRHIVGAKVKPKTIDMSKRLPDDTIHKVSKIEVRSKTYNNLIKEGYKRGTLTGKPTTDKKGKKPGATEFSRVINLIDKITNKGVNIENITPENVEMINAAANKIGYEFLKVKEKILPSEKRWWLFDLEHKERYTLRKKESLIGKTLPEKEGRIRRKIEKPKTKKADPLGIRK